MKLISQKSGWSLSILILAAGALPLAASGETVTFYFTGAVSSVYNPYTVMDPSIVKIGDPVQVSLRFDTTTPDSYPTDPTRGGFVGPGWLKVGINGLAFEHTDSVQIDIFNGADGKYFFQALALSGTVGAWPEAVASYPEKTCSLFFPETGPPYDLLSNAELPTTMDFSRADLRSGYVRSSAINLNMYEVQFNLTQVPEPSAGMHLVAGLLLWRLHRARRSMLC